MKHRKEVEDHYEPLEAYQQYKNLPVDACLNDNETLVMKIVIPGAIVQVWRVPGKDGYLYVTKYWIKGEYEPGEICPDLYNYDESVDRAHELARLLEI